MTVRFVGPGGSDANSGLTWALRKLTLNGAEDTPVVAGDIVRVAPGVYRELLTVDVSGGNVYSTGTVSVTLGSAVVTGSGTSWLANVAADYVFQQLIFATGTDGVISGTGTFTSAAGNFQSNMIGKDIMINTKGAYRILTVAGLTSITFSDPNGLGSPPTGSVLTYSVMSGEPPIDILSVDSNTQITLKENWAGITLSGLSYITYNPIRYIADVTGENTDGVGGVVRITGSDNDLANTRNNCITSTAKDYRTFQGFVFDTTIQAQYANSNSDYLVIQDCVFMPGVLQGVSATSTSTNITIRRCIFINGTSQCIVFSHTSVVDSAGHLVQNCLFIGGINGILFTRVGGATVKNCTFLSRLNPATQVGTAITTGQTITINNCIFYGNGIGMQGTVTGEITEDYNAFYGCSTNRTNIATGANSVAYPALLNPPILKSGHIFPWTMGVLGKWSPLARFTPAAPPLTDMFGMTRPVIASKNSLGAIQFQNIEKSSVQYVSASGSLKLADAGRTQIFVPSSAIPSSVSVQTYRETNYTGTFSQMIIKQPGQSDRITTDVNSNLQWNQLNDIFTPSSFPTYFVVELVSNNQAVTGSYGVYFDNLTVTGSSG